VLAKIHQEFHRISNAYYSVVHSFVQNLQFFCCFTDPYISLVVTASENRDGCFHLTTRGVPGRGATLLQEGSQPHQARGRKPGENRWDELQGSLLGGGNSNIFYFHPYLGKIPILTNIFQMG